jgi:hypothetical protein
MLLLMLLLVLLPPTHSTQAPNSSIIPTLHVDANLLSCSIKGPLHILLLLVLLLGPPCSTQAPSQQTAIYCLSLNRVPNSRLLLLLAPPRSTHAPNQQQAIYWQHLHRVPDSRLLLMRAQLHRNSRQETPLPEGLLHATLLQLHGLCLHVVLLLLLVQLHGLCLHVVLLLLAWVLRHTPVQEHALDLSGIGGWWKSGK